MAIPVETEDIAEMLSAVDLLYIPNLPASAKKDYIDSPGFIAADDSRNKRFQVQTKRIDTERTQAYEVKVYNGFLRFCIDPITGKPRNNYIFRRQYAELDAALKIHNLILGFLNSQD